jgi:hypothetical protein
MARQQLLSGKGPARDKNFLTTQLIVDPFAGSVKQQGTEFS